MPSGSLTSTSLARCHVDHNGHADRTQSATTATTGRSVAALLLPLRLFLAAGWLRGAVEKIIDPSWWTGEALDRFLVEQRPSMLPFFRWFSDALLRPAGRRAVAWLVVAMQIAIGACLLLGQFPRWHSGRA